MYVYGDLALTTLIHETVPWGRSLDEYVAMFNLTPADLAGSILDCGGGPSSFNAEATLRGTKVISCDPLYRFSRREIEERIAEVYPLLMNEMRLNHGTFRWDTLISPEYVGEVRMAAMNAFLADYEDGIFEDRYLEESLPRLSFPADSFDLALSSHFLFLYSAAFSFEFHVAAIREMLRVAREIRIYPLLAMGGSPSPHVRTAIAALRLDGFRVERVPTTYEFQIGATELLRVSKT